MLLFLENSQKLLKVLLESPGSVQEILLARLAEEHEQEDEEQCFLLPLTNHVFNLFMWFMPVAFSGCLSTSSYRP